MEPKKVMIVEDESTMYEMYKIKFEKEWFQVLVCTNWLSALAQIVEYQPDIILLDIMMPSMDGLETLSAIKELTTTIHAKIIIFSNISSQKEINKAMTLGADGYIVKANTTPKYIIDKIKTLI